jgi:hypothetical protein
LAKQQKERGNSFLVASVSKSDHRNGAKCNIADFSVETFSKRENANLIQFVKDKKNQKPE